MSNEYVSINKNKFFGVFNDYRMICLKATGARLSHNNKYISCQTAKTKRTVITLSLRFNNKTPFFVNKTKDSSHCILRISNLASNF